MKRANLLAVIGAAALGSTACSTPTSTTTTTMTTALRSHDASVVAPVPATPRTPASAAVLIADLSARLDDGDRRGAVPLLGALLHSDLLTDQGRANFYWLLADTAAGIDDDVRQDALGGFIVAASVVPEDAETRRRLRQARGALLAIKIKQQALGASPQQAIVVPSTTDADIVVAALECGKAGDGRYVERRLPGALRGDDPAPRRLLCTENGDVLTLWFRVESP
jgi:hypothetical protein